MKSKKKTLFRRYLIAGLLVWAPIGVTYIVIRFLIDVLDGTLALLPQQYRPELILGQHIPGLGIIFTLVILFFTGLLVTNVAGHYLINIWERCLARIPLIRSIYSAVKQVTQTFVQPQGQAFRQVVLVEHPRKGMWSIGFVTSTETFKALALENKEDVCAVFIPTTPSPASGFLALVSQKELINLNITIEEAFRMIISLGVLTPNFKPPPSTNETLSQ